MDFNEKMLDWKDKKVSILLDVHRNEFLKESYSGTLKEIGDDYIVLVTNNPNFHIAELLLRKDVILSIWLYNEEYLKNKENH